VQNFASWTQLCGRLRALDALVAMLDAPLLIGWRA